MDETPPTENPPSSADPAGGRALRRAGVHFVRAAIEVVAGLEVLIEGLRGGDPQPAKGGKPALQHIEIDDDDSPPSSPEE